MGRGRAEGLRLTDGPVSPAGSEAATRLLVAPDKFKGTIAAPEVAAAIAEGLRSAGLDSVEAMPLADGGEGTAEVMLGARGGRMATAIVHDPLGRPVEAEFAILGEGETAVVEMAQASGLSLVAEDERDAEAASSAGTGELIRAAVAAGAREVIVAVGGSAGTDGGRGALEALGGRFDGGGADLGALRSTLAGVDLVVAADVDNPMCGTAGAAAVFAPQKGAGRGGRHAPRGAARALGRACRRCHRQRPGGRARCGCGRRIGRRTLGIRGGPDLRRRRPRPRCRRVRLRPRHVHRRDHGRGPDRLADAARQDRRRRRSALPGGRRSVLCDRRPLEPPRRRRGGPRGRYRRGGAGSGRGAGRHRCRRDRTRPASDRPSRRNRRGTDDGRRWCW